MTAKRFTIMVDDAGTLIDMQTRDMFDIVEEVVDLLNKQHEENIELHIQNDFLKDENQHMRDLVNENERLRKDVARYRKNFREMEDVKCELAEENEQLKKELASFKPVIFESDGKPVTLYKKGDV